MRYDRGAEDTDGDIQQLPGETRGTEGESAILKIHNIS